VPPPSPAGEEPEAAPAPEPVPAEEPPQAAPPPEPVPAEEPTRPAPPPEPVAAEETVLEEEAAPTVAPLATSTLAELYYRQGLVDRATEVYRQLLGEEPGNEKARARLAELESRDEAHPPDPRETRRRALQRTIAGLEALLAVLRRR
jgi:hypothetical protein